MTIEQGSIIVTVILAAYTAVAQYSDFIASLQRLIEHLRSLLAGFFHRFTPIPPRVTGAWSPGPGLLISQHPNRPQGPSVSPLIMWYVIASNAGLLVLFGWLVIRTLLIG